MIKTIKDFMKIVNLFSVCLAVMVLGSCSKENVEDLAPASEFKIISSVKTVRTPQLDADGAGNFETGDQNSVFFHTLTNKSLYQFTYEYGQQYFWEGFNLPAEVSSCQVSACYPVVLTKNPENFAWDILKHTDMSDFLMAAPVTADTHSSSPVVLTFSHALHKLVVSLRSESEGITDEMLKTAEISCRNVYPIANLNLLEGKPVGASGTLTAMKKIGKITSFIIPEQNVEKMEIVIKIGNNEKIFPLSSSIVGGQPLTKLEYGKTFTLSLGVKENHIFIIGQDINGWGNQGNADGIITI